MLAEWYFCCCIDASPANTNIFLHIWQAIHDRKSNQQDLASAIEELHRAEIWMQLYLFPEVLGALQRADLLKNTRAIIEKYCRGLLDFLPAEKRRPFSELLDTAYFNYAATTAEQIKTCARLLSHPGDQTVSATPYLDLPDFIGQTLILAVLANVIQHDRHSSSKVRAALGESDELKVLLDRALKHRYGRLAFRLAAGIAHLTAVRDERQLKVICNNQYCTPELEPDLMQMNSRLYFTKVSAGGHPDILTDEIVREITMLSKLNEVALSDKKRADRWPAVLGRFGYTTDIGESLSIICWQATLWQLAAESDNALSALAKYWAMPGDRRAYFKVSTPFSGEKAEHWLSMMQLLLKLRRVGAKIELSKYITKEIEIHAHSRWTLFSPWIRVNHRNFWKGSEDKEYRYPSAIDPVTLILLLTSADISIKILQLLPVNDSRRTAFGCLLVHASSVISIYEYWLRNHDKPKFAERLAKHYWKQELPITGLMLFGWDRIAFAGRGLIEAISPDFFVDLLQLNPTKDAGPGQEQISIDEKEFYRSVLPEVLMSWVASAYTGASDSSGSGRWQRHLEDIYSFYKLGSHDNESAVEAALVMRFLGDRSVRITHGNFDWRSQGPTYKIKPRMFLLTKPLSIETWARIGSNYKDQRALHIYTERIAALRTNPTSEYATDWRRDWVEAMNRINVRQDLDRFMRLRLVELLEPDDLELSDQELITLVLVEWGVYNELMRMFDCIYFPKDRTSQRKKDLGEFLATAIYRYIETSSRAQGERLNPGHLQHIRIEIDRVALMQRVLAKLAYLNRFDAIEQNAGTLGNRLVELENAALLRQLIDDTRVSHGLLERHGHDDVIIADNAEAIRPWMVKGITYDPNTRDLTFATINLNSEGVTNLFALKQAEYQAFLEDKHPKAQEVLAVVVKSEQTGSHPHDYTYTFNCGLPTYLTAQRHDAVALPEGAHVALPIFKLPQNTGEPAQWNIQESKVETIRQLEAVPSAGDLIEVEVKEELETTSGTRKVKVFYRGTECRLESLTSWDGNLSAVFQKPLADRPSYAVVSAIVSAADLSVTPKDRGLTTLILQGLAYSDASVAILTLLSQEVVAAAHEKAWRFSRRPGENYELKWSDFAPEDAKRLDAAVSQQRDPYGLIVAVTPELENERVRLRLVTEKVQDQKLDILYPQLEVPFDLRNLKWQSLFKQDENAVATRKDRWTVAVGNKVSGFPQEVEVVWKRGNPPARFHEVEFDVEDWDPRTGIVMGSYVQQQSLDVAPADYDRFLNYWLEPPQKSRVELKRVRSRVRTDGMVWCLTKENMDVLVDAESLSMRAISEQSALIEPAQIRVAEVYLRSRWIEITDESKKPLTPTIEVDQLEPVINGNECSGILLDVPQEVGTMLYQVLWSVKGKAALLPLRMRLKNERPIPAGARISGELRDDGWHWKLEKLSVRCRALWRLNSNLRPPFEQSYYLCTVWLDNREKPIVQVRPGELAVLPSEPQVRHLALGDGEVFQDLMEAGHPTTNVCTNDKPWRDEGMELSRSVLRLNNRFLLPGFFAGDRPHGAKLAVDDVSMFARARAGGYFRLQRIFNVSEIREELRTAPESPVVIREDWQKRLDDYFLYPNHDSRRTLRATMAGTTAQITDVRGILVPQTRDALARWTDTVRIPQSELPFIAPTRANYSRTGVWIVLYRDESSGVIYGSYRRVPPQSVDDYRSSVATEPGRFTSLKEPLFYIGPEEINPLTHENYRETHHRFEYGAGKMLVAPESHLRFEEDPFSSSKYLLNSGDKITGITFRTEREGLIIDIRTYNFNTRKGAIEPSPRSELYHDRKNHIVHVLHLLAYPDEHRLEVEYVGRFDRHGDDKLLPQSDINGVLDEQDTNQILEHLSERQDVERTEGAARFQVLGRLDKEGFEDLSNRGMVVPFNYVRLSFIDCESGSCLKPRERIFLIADGVDEKITNDFALTLSWRGIIDPVDVGPDFQGRIRLLRRNFSIRENRMERIYASAGSAELINKKFLVQVSPYKNRVSCSLVADPLIRSVDVLETLIDLNGPQIATVSSADEKNIQIELKPGLYCEVSKGQIEEPHPVLSRGTTIKVEPGERKKFRIQLAAYSDIRYVPREGRLGLALPKNHLFERNEWLKPEILEDKYWSTDRRSFSIGSLPNVTLLAGVFQEDSGHWKLGLADDCRHLMEMRHPRRIVFFGRARFMPVTDHKSVGRLQLADNGREVHYNSLDETTEMANGAALPWRLLTFADQSVTEVVSRINSERWEYHDSSTVTVTSRNGDVETDPYPTGKHTGWRGPLFFETTDNQRRLRYTRAHLFQFGYPVEELILSLARKKKQQRGFYIVAGVPDEGGLWLELSPGRIVELPPNLVVGQRRHEEFELDIMNWSAFAPGDIVELEATSRNPLLVDRILLRSWTPGARGAFGRTRALLPVCGRDREHGSLSLGSAEFTVSIPDANPDSWGELVALDPNNCIDQGAEVTPRPGDVVLLGLNEVQRPMVIGFSKLVPEADTRPWLTKCDKLASAYVENQNGSLTYNRKGLHQLIKSIGGALPVTVEFVEPLNNEQRALRFSRRHQMESTAKLGGRITYATVLGFQSDENAALLRCGGDILKIKMRHVISGLPGNKELLWETANVLKAEGTRILIHALEDNRLQTGLPTESKESSKTELLIAPLHVVSVEHPTGWIEGLICRSADSMRLYWLPSSDAAWTKLSAEQLRILFLSKQGEYLKAAIRPDGTVSIVRAAAALKEFESCRIGKQLAVTAILERSQLQPGRRVYVGQSFSSKVMLECSVKDNFALTVGKSSAMEVSSYARSPYRVTVEPVGTVDKALDVPKWMLQVMKPGSRANRREFKEYLRWREEAHEPPAEIHDLEQLPTEQLNRLLVQMYETLDNKLISDQLRIRVARAWKLRNEKAQLIDLHFGIMAVLLFEQIGLQHGEITWRISARKLTQNLAERALRSLHVELLFKRWISKAAPGNELRADLWNRLREVMAAVADPPNKDTLQHIRQFSRAIQLRSITRDSRYELREIQVISESLSAAIGDFSEGLFKNKLEEESITRSLALIHQTLPHTNAPVNNMNASENEMNMAGGITLDLTHVQKLEELLTVINQSRMDITLLDNLVALEVRSRDGR